MVRFSCFRYLPLAAAIGLAATSRAQTMLVSIPIADVLGHREGSFSYTLTGYEASHNPGYTHSNLTVLGFFDRAEIGVSNDFTGNTVYAGKLALVKATKKCPCALSAGTMNYRDSHGQPFVVGRLDLKGMRLHAGYLRTDMNRMIVGVDAPLPIKDWSIAADYTSGPSGYTWVGMNIPVKSLPGFSLMPMLAVPSLRADGYQHALAVNYGFKF